MTDRRSSMICELIPTSGRTSLAIRKIRISNYSSQNPFQPPMQNRPLEWERRKNAGTEARGSRIIRINHAVGRQLMRGRRAQVWSPWIQGIAHRMDSLTKSYPGRNWIRIALRSCKTPFTHESFDTRIVSNTGPQTNLAKSKSKPLYQTK